MKKLIQELKLISVGYDPRPLPGYVAEIWVPTRNGPALERVAKSEDWWMYGRRRAGKGLAFFIRIEGGSRQRRWVEHELAKLDGEWRGKPGSKDRRVAQQMEPPARVAS